MKDLVENVNKGTEVRSNLIKLKEMLKEASDSDAFLQILDWDMDFFRKLLKHEDAKVRKNIVQIIGICELDGLTDELFEAYEQEETLFVRPEYLKVLKDYDIGDYVSALVKRQQELLKQEQEETLAKHTSGELRQLSAILKDYGQIKGHQFIGADVRSTMVLTTLSGKEKYLKEAIDRQITEGLTVAVKGGVKVTSADYENLMKVRCFQELLFVLPGADHITSANAGKQIVEAGLLNYLDKRLSGSSAYPFRIDIRGRLDKDEKIKLTKKISQEIESASHNKMINSTSDYEVEIRLIKKKSEEEEYSVYLKIPLLADERFSYRVHALGSSIQPYVAAMMMEIAQPYIEGRGQVLDPFCGVGTLLMERNYREHAHSLYGVDIYGQAVSWAEEQAMKAKMNIHYINKDMMDFEHKYLFELIVTNPPVPSGRMMTDEIESIYEGFFDKCQEWLAQDAVLVVYSQAPEVWEKVLKRQRYFKTLMKTDMYKKGQSKMYVIQYV